MASRGQRCHSEKWARRAATSHAKQCSVIARALDMCWHGARGRPLMHSAARPSRRTHASFIDPSINPPSRPHAQPLICPAEWERGCDQAYDGDACVAGWSCALPAGIAAIQCARATAQAEDKEDLTVHVTSSTAAGKRGGIEYRAIRRPRRVRARALSCWSRSLNSNAPHGSVVGAGASAVLFLCSGGEAAGLALRMNIP